MIIYSTVKSVFESVHASLLFLCKSFVQPVPIKAKPPCTISKGLLLILHRVNSGLAYGGKLYRGRFDFFHVLKKIKHPFLVGYFCPIIVLCSWRR